MKQTVFIILIWFCANIVLLGQNISQSTDSISSIVILTDSCAEFQDTIQSLADDTLIVYPESMTEDLGKLLHAWQLDLTKVDIECEGGDNLLLHDSVYAERLYRLPTEIELSFNTVVKKHIEMYAGRRREQVSYMLALGDYYFPMFEEALDREGLPLELKYLPVIESALNPFALSRAGASGLWQFMLKTGKGYGLEVNSLVDERRDPDKSTAAAVSYLKDLYMIYGDWSLVIAAYNCGPGNVNKAIARSDGRRDYWEIYHRLPRETRGYIPAFIAANYIMNYYADHNICPANVDLTTLAFDTVHVNSEIHFEQIAAVLQIPVDEIKRLNPQFKLDKIPANNKTYSLVLPTEKIHAFIEQNDSIINYNRVNYFGHRVYTDGYMDGTYSVTEGNMVNIYYSVKSGDNLSLIAARNGTTVSRLKSWNSLKSDRLSIGKRLIVRKEAAPTPVVDNTQLLAQADGAGDVKVANTYYRVRKGDTLGEIAQKNNIPLSQLRAWNGLTTSRINIGDQLIVGRKEIVLPPPEEEVSPPEEVTPSEEVGSPEEIVPPEEELPRQDVAVDADSLDVGNTILIDSSREELSKAAEEKEGLES